MTWLAERHYALGRSLAMSFGTLKGVQYLLRQNLEIAGDRQLDGAALANMLELVVDSLEQVKLENDMIVADFTGWAQRD